GAQRAVRAGGIRDQVDALVGQGLEGGGLEEVLDAQAEVPVDPLPPGGGGLGGGGAGEDGAGGERTEGGQHAASPRSGRLRGGMGRGGRVDGGPPPSSSDRCAQARATSLTGQWTGHNRLGEFLGR